MVAAPREFPKRIKLQFFAGEAGDVGFVYFVKGARVEVGHDAGLHVGVVGEIFEAAVGRCAENGVVGLEGPGHAEGFALVDEADDRLFGKRYGAVELVVNGDAVSAVADHVCEAQLVHAVDGHCLQAAGGDAEKMTGFAAFFQCEDRRLGDVGVMISACEQRSVDVKKEISSAIHICLLFVMSR